jgi:hypothetical protein
VVDGRPYQPRTRDKDALAELDDLDDILDRVFSKLCVEFGSKTDNLDELDNPINHCRLDEELQRWLQGHH